MDNIQRVIDFIKLQAEAFLLSAKEFYPFGTCIGKQNNIIPIAAYIEDKNDRPESTPLIEMLENSIKKGIANGDYIIGALAYDAYITENEEKFDAIMICIYTNDSFEKRHFRYYIYETYVEFV